MSASVYRPVLLIVAAVLLTGSVLASADLQNVTVGGEIRIRGNWWMSTFNGADRPLFVRYETRWPADWMAGRAIGSFLGGQSASSHFGWNANDPDYRLVEQRTKLHIKADFTDNVSAFVELDSFDAWGEDFRSNYLTGIDARANSSDDLELYQAYIDADNVCGAPVRLRVGRQELSFGGGWLLGDNSALPEFTGLSFDAVRATYTHDLFTVDAFWAKLVEASPREEDGDTDLSGVYASYKGIENVAIDAFWFWLRDAQAIRETNDPIKTWLGRLSGLGNYDPTNLHTVGLHATGTFGGFDFRANAAYQFGDAGSVGALFKPYGFGDNKAGFDAWAGDLDLGYTFDFTCKPRVHIGGAYYGGEDNRGITFGEWLDPFAPLERQKASVSFNRLFSNTVNSYFIDEMGELSDFWMARAGLSANPAKSIETGLDVSYLGVLETFEAPRIINVGPHRVALAKEVSFLTRDSGNDLGWELDLWLKYRWSADLGIEAGWSHLFTGKGLAEGNFNDMHGLQFNGGTGDDDADYLYLQTSIRF